MNSKSSTCIRSFLHHHVVKGRLLRQSKVFLTRKSTTSLFATSCISSSSSSSSSLLGGRLQIHPEVQEAIQTNKPVVALESTILSHGLPYPDNLRLANDLSTIFRLKGVTPATVAVKDGVCHVGLTKEDLCDLVVAAPEGRANKCSTRDLPFFMRTNSDVRSNGEIHWGGK